jgi:hypothetical protein
MATPIQSASPATTTRTARVLASPEEIFLAWLLSLPDDVDATDAAAEEIARLDRDQLRSPEATRLRELFVVAAKCAVPRGRLS